MTLSLRTMVLGCILASCAIAPHAGASGEPVEQTQQALGSAVRVPRFATLPLPSEDGNLALLTTAPRGLWMRGTAGPWFSIDAETINVKELGAKGDGVTDDAVAIANALDAVGAQGGIVRFPPGTYIVGDQLGGLNCPAMTSGLCPKSKTRIVGAGPNVSVIKRSGSAGALFYQMGGNDYGVESIGLDANGIGSGQHSNFFTAIGFNNVSRVVIRDTRIFDSSGLPSSMGRHGILVQGSNHAFVSQNLLEGGLRIKVGGPGSHVIVSENIVEDANDNAITLALDGSGETTDYLIRGNIIQRALGASIFFGSDDGVASEKVRDIVIEGNSIKGPVQQGGAMIIGRLPDTELGRVVIQNNVLDNDTTQKLAWTTGIILTPQTPPYTQRAHDVIVSNNSIHGPFDYAGIWLNAVDKSTIAGNTIDCSPMPACNGAIYLTGVADIAVNGNTLSNGNNGLLVGDSQRLNVTGNAMRDVTTGITLMATTSNTTSASVTANTIAATGDGLFEHPFTGGSYDTSYANNDLRNTTTPMHPATIGQRKSNNAGEGVVTSAWSPSVGAGACTTTTLTMPHALAGDAVTVSYSTALPAGAILTGSASYGAVTVVLCGLGTAVTLNGNVTASVVRR